MSAKARIILTAAFGVVLGLHMWLGTEGFSPSPGLEEVFSSRATEMAFFCSLILVPLIVGRWWVLAALAGWVIASVALRLTGHVPQGGSDGDEWGLLWTIVGLAFWGFIFLILVGIRKAFDHWRQHRVTRKLVDTRLAVSNSSDS